MSRYLLLVVVVGILAVDGYATGRWTGRWGDNKELAVAVERLERVPMTVGEWKGTPEKLDAGALAQSGFHGYILRRYENTRTGAVVHVLLACGRPGPLAVHTPEVCYGGAGYEPAEAPTRGGAGPGKVSSYAEFWRATFVKANKTSPEKLHLIWAWYHKGNWKASSSPRWTFAGSQVLYKVYITQAYLPQENGTNGEDAENFLRDFLPVVEDEIASTH